MLMGEVIKERRLKKNLRQWELAKGICHQGYISSLEASKKASNIDTLIKILQRLDLTLNDVYSEFADNVRPTVIKQLTSTEQKMLIGLQPEFEPQFDAMDIKKQSNDNEIMAQATYIQALAELQRKHDEDAIFQFNNVLMYTKNDTYKVHTLLAYLGLAEIYHQHSEDEKSERYISLVKDSIKENLNLSDAVPEQLIFILRGLSRYYANFDARLAAKFAQEGIEFNKNHLMNMFIDEFYYVLAKAASMNKDKKNFNEFRDNAKMFANYFEHQDILKLIKALDD